MARDERLDATGGVGEERLRSILGTFDGDDEVDDSTS